MTRAGTWSDAEKAKLRELWPVATRADLARAFPGRTLGTLSNRASRLRISRLADRLDTAAAGVDRVFVLLRQARRRQRLPQPELAKLLGVHRVTLNRWETGRDTPCWAMVVAWARVLGYRLDLALRIGMAR